MKIAFVVSTFPKLSETFILNQITGLLDMGYDVQIFAEYRNVMERKVHPDVDRYRLMERTHYFTTPDNHLARLIKAVYLFFTSFVKSPSKVLDALNIFRHGRNALSLRTLYILIPFLGKKFDITHFHFATNGALGITLKGMDLLGKIITSFHGYDVNSFPRAAGKRFYNRLFREGDLFTANTNFTKKQAVMLGCDEKKIRVLPVGFRVERFEFNERRPEPGKPVKILTVGRLVEKKGHEYAIRAVARLIDEGKDVVYMIAGGGPLRRYLEKLASDLWVSKHVRFLDEVRQDEVVELYRDSHIFVLPSVTAADEDREGQALVLQEAQATGMPVVSTYHNGIPEGVLNCKSGFLVPERKVDALVEKIKYLIDHPDIWPAMGRQGRKFVETKYNISRLNNRLMEIYREMTSNGNAARARTA